MSDSEAFAFVCGQLEEKTGLDRLAVRGTVRLALKQAGLEARSVAPDQMKVVVEKLLPAELSSRGIEAGEGVCQTIGTGLGGMASGPSIETPDAVFKRLGGGA